MSANNILNFPESRILFANTAGPAPEMIRDLEGEEKFKANIRHQTNTIVDHYAQELINNFIRHGYKTDTVEFSTEFSVIVEFIRAALFKNVGMEHPFTPYLEEIINKILEEIDIEEDDEDDGL